MGVIAQTHPAVQGQHKQLPRYSEAIESVRGAAGIGQAAEEEDGHGFEALAAAHWPATPAPAAADLTESQLCAPAGKDRAEMVYRRWPGQACSALCMSKAVENTACKGKQVTELGSATGRGMPSMLRRSAVLELECIDLPSPISFGQEWRLVHALLPANHCLPAGQQQAGPLSRCMCAQHSEHAAAPSSTSHVVRQDHPQHSRVEALGKHCCRSLVPGRVFTPHCSSVSHSAASSCRAGRLGPAVISAAALDAPLATLCQLAVIRYIVLNSASQKRSRKDRAEREIQ